MSKTPLKVDCPTCRNKVIYSELSPYRPFCSERCQQIDLGAWSTEEYSIPCNQQDEWEIDEHTQRNQGSTIQ